YCRCALGMTTLAVLCHSERDQTIRIASYASSCAAEVARNLALTHRRTPPIGYAKLATVTRG
ncbi:MAG: hypothetical protein WAM05_08875, partial [Candidatus Binataceae bacterium]